MKGKIRRKTKLDIDKKKIRKKNMFEFNKKKKQFTEFDNWK